MKLAPLAAYLNNVRRRRRLTLDPLGGEDGLYVDFVSGRAYVNDSSVPANSFRGDVNDLLTYTSPSVKYVRNAAGLLVAGTTIRCDHDAAGNPLGARIEGARTNLLLNSDFSGAASGIPGTAPTSWSTLTVQGATTVSAGSRSGSQKILISNPSLRHSYQQTVSVSADTVYFFSVLVDSIAGVDALWQNITVVSLPAGATLEFLIDGAVVAGGSNLPLGRHEIAVRLTIGATAGTASFRWGTGLQSNTAVQRDISFERPQLEVGVFRSSDIVTTGSQVTRAADNIQLATTKFPWGAVGTVITRFRPRYTAGQVVTGGFYSSVFGHYPGVPNIVVMTAVAAAASVYYSQISNVATTGGAFAAGVTARYGAAWDANGMRAAINGVLGSQTAAAAITPNPTNVFFGKGSATGGWLHGHLTDMIFVPRRMPDAELQTRAVL